jgi:hypothetical protein
MDETRLNDWQPLFASALRILDAAVVVLGDFPWSFGGGTALMLKYRHRYSKDVDIFLRDPQFIGHVSPRLSPAAEAETSDYEEAGEFVKLRLQGGEIDFIAAGWLTSDPYRPEMVMGRNVNVETPAEIVGKKIRHRASTFKARDLFDFAIVAERAPDEIARLAPLIQEYRPVMAERIEKRRDILQEEFDALDLIGNRKTLDDCITAIYRSFKAPRK